MAEAAGAGDVAMATNVILWSTMLALMSIPMWGCWIVTWHDTRKSHSPPIWRPLIRAE